MFYPAYIHSDPDGSASGFSPDVPCRYFAGDTLDNAFRDARSALVAHFETLCEMNEELPLPGLCGNTSGPACAGLYWWAMVAGGYQYESVRRSG